MGDSKNELKDLKDEMYSKYLETIEKFLEVEFPERVLKKYFSLSSEKYRTFEDRHKLFLIKYSILKEHNSATNRILGEIREEPIKTNDNYFKENPHVKAATEILQKRYDTFGERKKEDCAAFFDPEKLDGFANFLNWWYSKVDINGIRKCCYCGIDEITCKLAFEKEIISSAKFTGTLHIERKDPHKGYNKDNCEFACALCNNAKSDMISEDDFITYFREPMQKYWNQIKEKLEKKQ